MHKGGNLFAPKRFSRFRFRGDNGPGPGRRLQPSPYGRIFLPGRLRPGIRENDDFLADAQDLTGILGPRHDGASLARTPVEDTHRRVYS